MGTLDLVQLCCLTAAFFCVLRLWLLFHRAEKALCIAVDYLHWIDDDQRRERALERVRAALEGA